MASAAVRVAGDELEHQCLEAQDLEQEVGPSVKMSWPAVARAALGLGVAVGCAGYALAARSTKVGIVSDAKHIVSDYIAPPFQDMLCPVSSEDEVAYIGANCADMAVEIMDKYNVIDCQKAAFEVPNQATDVGTKLVYYFKYVSDPDIAGNSKNPGVCFTIPTSCTQKIDLKAAKAVLPNMSDKDDFHTCEIQQPQCFPGDATVSVHGWGRAAMASVRVGDKVLVESKDGRLVYEEVLSFLHSAPSAQGSVARILHSEGEFRATANHLVFVADGSTKMVGALKPGDAVLVAREGSRISSPVMAVGSDLARGGVFAPLTASGTVVVDDVVASNYGSPSEVPLPHGAAHASFFVARFWHAAVAALGWSPEASAAADQVHFVAKAYLDMGLSSLLSPVKA